MCNAQHLGDAFVLELVDHARVGSGDSVIMSLNVWLVTAARFRPFQRKSVLRSQLMNVAVTFHDHDHVLHFTFPFSNKASALPSDMTR